MRRIADLPLDRLLYIGLIALLIASTMNGLSFQWRVSGMEFTVRPDQIVLVFLTPFVVLASIIGRFRLQPTLFEWVVLGFIASNFTASVLFSPFQSVSLKGAFVLSAYAAMYFVVRQILTNRAEWLPDATNWTFGLGIVQAAYCLIALVLYSFGHVIGGLQIGHLTPGSVAIKGTFWEPNILAAYLGLVALLLMIRYLLRTERPGGGTELFGLFITSLALPLTVTRAAGLALMLGIVSLAVLVCVFRREIREWRARAGKVIVTLGAVLLLTVTAMDDFVSNLSRYPNLLLERWIPISLSVTGGDASAPATSAVGAEGSATARKSRIAERDVTRASRNSVVGRVGAWTQALEGWRERPVLGHGTLAGADLVEDGWWYSSLVQALYDTGLVGFVVLLWIYVAAVVLPARTWLRTRQSSMSANLLGFGAGNAVLAFSSQFSSFLFLGFPWVFLGLTMAAVQAGKLPCLDARRHLVQPIRRVRLQRGLLKEGYPAEMVRLDPVTVRGAASFEQSDERTVGRVNQQSRPPQG